MCLLAVPLLTCIQGGRLQDAFVILFNLPANNVVTWNGLIAIAQFMLHNDHRSAFSVHASMMQACIELNDVTFISLLCACSGTGLVDEGCSYFKSMIGKHGLQEFQGIRPSNQEIHILKPL